MLSAAQASARPTVAIAGATAELVLLSRQKLEGNPLLVELGRKGGKVVVYDEAQLRDSLKGVDVLINV